MLLPAVFLAGGGGGDLPVAAGPFHEGPVGLVVYVNGGAVPAPACTHAAEKTLNMTHCACSI